jgi:hypothetical protein
MDNNSEMLIVPTQELIFAVKKDGSIITNFSENRGGGVNEVKAEYFRAYFEGIHKFLKTCSSRELVAYALLELLERDEIHGTIIKRMEEEKSKSDQE